VSKVIWHVTMSWTASSPSLTTMDWVVGESSDDGTTTPDIEADRGPVAAA
jgi:hypothetical protein